MQWRSTGGVLLLAGALVALSGPLGPGTAGAAAPRTASAAAAPAEGPDPIDFAVVVDQSKSLADKDLALETEAAALLSQGEISERSRATVIGFGSSEKPGQSPVREVCPLTVADAAGRQRLSDCVPQLTRRDSARMGPGTDFPAAIRQAVSRLTEDGRPTTPKVVFLLTDGRLDVGDSPEYGPDKASRQSNGEKRLAEELARARAASVQIWPLGFGGEIDEDALTAMAEGGYRGSCADVPGAVPRMRVVDTAAGIDKALQETFAAARCARIAHGTVGKPPADLSVTIPPIATDGSLTVGKHDPKVRVTYYDPSGRKVPTQGEFDGSTFEVSGQDGPVEALRVKNPMPGRWRVHIEAPEGHRDREVAVRAIWQGRLRSEVILDPASPRAGEEVVVAVRMQTRRGVVITDPKQLEGVKVSAVLSGAGFAPVTVRLADDGRAPDQRAGDVRFTGRITVPATATGDLELVTDMAAPGVTSDRRPLHARTAQGTPAVTAGITVDRVTVHPGATVRGTLDVTNNDSVPHSLRLGLTDQAAGADLELSPATVTAEPGRSTRFDFTLAVGRGTPVGELGGQVVLLDTGDGDRALDTAFLDVRVEAPPTWWDRWWWAVAAAAAVLLIAAAVTAAWARAQIRRKDLTGVRLELLRDGTVLSSLTIRKGQSRGGEYLFAVDEPRGAAPTLRRSRGGSTAHRLRRTGGGELLLRPHGGRESGVRPGVPAGLGGFELVVGGRAGRGGGTGGGTGGRTGGTGRSGGPGRPDGAGRPTGPNRTGGGGGWRDRFGRRSATPGDRNRESGRDRDTGSRDRDTGRDRDPGSRDRDTGRDPGRTAGGDRDRDRSRDRSRTAGSDEGRAEQPAPSSQWDPNF
ncbi:VWA domain-containing protein [Streptomyces sp. Je 1-79]|uniref:vWA domain-containing protein n=1 Tax=Streptomyces sp. Je 1-79 TaxID=2943847 RepID=UPI0021A89B33|nr:vWA domain-containing protein [Streptomyces sp. Je 1-79]MCT4352405.1 VWA domain-containing protein [Streptomyces sp. Je 1-79]